MKTRRVLTFFTVSVFIGFSASSAGAQIYRWTTSNGTMAFGDRLPRGGGVEDLSLVIELPGALSIVRGPREPQPPSTVRQDQAAGPGQTANEQTQVATATEPDLEPTRVYLVDEELVGRDFSGQNMVGAYLAWSDMANVTLHAEDLSGADMFKVNLLHAEMTEAALPRAILTEANLLSTSLQGADLQDAALDSANLRSGNLSEAVLRQADLVGANLHGAQMSQADLQGADLTGAYLESANLRGADLRGAILVHADFRHADLRQARLEGADLTGAFHLLEEQIQSASIDDRTRLPLFASPPAAFEEDEPPLRSPEWYAYQAQQKEIRTQQRRVRQQVREQLQEDKAFRQQRSRQRDRERQQLQRFGRFGR